MEKRVFTVGVVAGAVLMLAIMVGLQSGDRTAEAQGVDAARSVIMTTASVEPDVDVIVLMDADLKRLAYYDMGRGKALNLVAVRNVTWDLQCPLEFTRQGSKGPTVSEIKKEIEKAKGN